MSNLLQAKGVKSVIVADECAGLPLFTSGGVHLEVLNEYAEYAREILRDAHN